MTHGCGPSSQLLQRTVKCIHSFTADAWRWMDQCREWALECKVSGRLTSSDSVLLIDWSVFRAARDCLARERTVHNRDSDPRVIAKDGWRPGVGWVAGQRPGRWPATHPTHGRHLVRSWDGARSTANRWGRACLLYAIRPGDFTRNYPVSLWSIMTVIRTPRTVCDRPHNSPRTANISAPQTENKAKQSHSREIKKLPQFISSRHKTLNQCWLDVGPTS